jgi:hypothetical protein
MGSIGLVEISILGAVVLAGIAILMVGIVFYAWNRRQGQK